MQDIVLRAPLVSAPTPGKAMSIPVPYRQAIKSLDNFLAVPHILEIVEHNKLTEKTYQSKLKFEIPKILLESMPPERTNSVLGNLLATKIAASKYSRRYLKRKLAPQEVFVRHHLDGKPELCFTNDFLPLFAGVDLSLADGAGMSVAWIGPTPAGVDIEAVEERDADTWWELLGRDGCASALRLATEINEPFDRAATRIWTILESQMKAYSSRNLAPDFDLTVNGLWVSMTGSLDGRILHFLSSIINIKAMVNTEAVLTISL